MLRWKYMTNVVLILGLVGGILSLIGIVVGRIPFLRVRGRGKAALLLIGSLVLFSVGASLLGDTDLKPSAGRSIDDIVGSAQSIEYDELLRYPEKYKGTAVRFRGSILQKIGDNEFRVGTKYLSSLGTYSSDDVLYATLHGEAKGTPILEDDVVEFVGEAVGTVTYKAVLGNKITIPHIRVYQVAEVRKGANRY